MTFHALTMQARTAPQRTGGKVPLAGIPMRNLPDQLPEFVARGFTVVSPLVQVCALFESGLCIVKG